MKEMHTLTQKIAAIRPVPWSDRSRKNKAVGIAIVAALVISVGVGAVDMATNYHAVDSERTNLAWGASLIAQAEAYEAHQATVAGHLEAEASLHGVQIVFTDQQPCGAIPRQGVWNEDLGYIGVAGCYTDRAPDTIFLSPAGSGEDWEDLGADVQTSWSDVLKHELGHRLVNQKCGTSSPDVVGDRGENVADVLAVTEFGAVSSAPGGYGSETSDWNLAHAVLRGECA